MIEFKQVDKRFGSELAVKQLSIRVNEGQLCVLLGSSGCGKSTTLRLVNRLIDHDQGHIYLNGKDIRDYDVTHLRRQIGYAIQDTGLFPHWSVAENIATVPKLLKWSKSAIDQRVDELLALLNMQGYGNKRPHQLSGGQAQRVGVARALAGDPDVLLMDEPFAALDPITREHLQNELLAIQSKLGKTILFVTHDIDEALRIADHIVLMDAGEVVQQGDPLSLLTKPNSEFVAQFLGGERRGLKLAKLTRIDRFVTPGVAANGPKLDHQQTVESALSAMLLAGTDQAQVYDQARYLGALYLADVRYAR